MPRCMEQRPIKPAANDDRLGVLHDILSALGWPYWYVHFGNYKKKKRQQIHAKAIKSIWYKNLQKKKEAGLIP